MRLLLDTHVFLWWILDSPGLSQAARSAIQDGSNAVFWSAASSWEVSIKYALGRLPLPAEPERFLPMELARNGVQPLTISDAHAFRAGQLPLHHKDPFDRMLVAQAQVEALTLISSDPLMRPYAIDLLM